MKKRIFIALTVILLLAITLSSLLLTTVAAAENDSARELDATTVAQLDVTDSYFYDRISERQQWCYNWLKDYYDNFTGEPGTYDIDVTYLLPEQFVSADVDGLFTDFLVGDSALKADDPLYELKGEVSSMGTDIDYQNIYGSYAIMGITNMEINTDEVQKQVEAGVRQAVETIGEGDRYTKLYKLAHYILTKGFYDPFPYEISGSGDREKAFASKGHYWTNIVSGFFIDGVAVCDGFADTVKVLCNALDIPCVIIGNASHAWNMVQMEDGSWYHFDVTREKLGWDGHVDMELFYSNYFLKVNQWEDRHNPPYYTIGVDHVYYANEFPAEAEADYVYTGETTDFSYTVAPSTYVPCEPKFVYKVNQGGKTCTIVHYEGREEGDLVIPETIDGYTVTAIDPCAFYLCSGFDGKLILPDTVETIGKAAFAGCYNLTSLELSKNLYEIGVGAFAGCKALTDVVLPDSVLKVKDLAFYDCDKLTTLTFGGHVQSMGERVFAEIAGTVTLKAPAGSPVEKYASDGSVLFEALGEMCTFVDVDGKWEYNDGGHFRVCEHGVRFNYARHSGKYNYIMNCGEQCGTCGVYYCATNGFTDNLEMHLEGAHPATCMSPEYTGDLICSCGRGGRPGEYVGEPSSEHTPADHWNTRLTNNNHYQTCIYCGVDFNEGEHFGGTATYTEKAKCEACGTEYGKVIPHEHTGGTATVTEQARCELCGKYYGARLPADQSSDKNNDSVNGQGGEKAPLDPTFIIIGVAAAVVLIVAVVLIAVAKKKRTAKAKREE